MSDIKKDFVHTVFFWLKNPENSDDRQKFEASLKTFIKNSEFVKASQVGIPSVAQRDVIDSSYTYSLLTTFPSREEHDKYQVEPAHTTFINECKDLWSKVLVYDSESIY